jgi:hypothetical protein
MASAIDPTKPTDGVPSVKLDLRTNLQAAKTEIESLQTGKSDVGHQHALGDLTDAGALAAKNVIGAGDIAVGALDGISINMQDQPLIRPVLKDFSETSTTPAVSAGVLTLDLETANVFEVTLTQNVTTLTLANPPAAGRAGSCTLILKQDATGGRTLAWPGSVLWPGGTAPVMTGTANAADIIALATRDGGATWYGFPGGKDFS